MNGAKKIMNANEALNITEEDRKAAMALLENASSIDVDQALSNYKEALDSYCSEFNANDYLELMNRADESEFTPKVCAEILDKYSFIQRYQA